MKKSILASSILLASLALSGAANACDMHGGGFGFGMRNAPWQTYTPKVSTTDPALMQDDKLSKLATDKVPLIKPRPSFSNAANLAAMKAKAKLASKDRGESSADKPEMKKTASKRG
ncbi:hypothetical protein [Hellea balneolensis]|uniref:hypothetical protein n=1 Tax=Hellea balneolensis TaxID=287478 RepID=UPI0012B6BEBF|nr:hypothetical protein [Hellea balneolensis]